MHLKTRETVYYVLCNNHSPLICLLGEYQSRTLDSTRCCVYLFIRPSVCHPVGLSMTLTPHGSHIHMSFTKWDQIYVFTTDVNLVDDSLLNF